MKYGWPRQLLIALAIAVAPVAGAAAEIAPGEARMVAARFVALSNSRRLLEADARLLLSGELADFPHATLGPNLPAPDRAVSIEERRAVARIPARGGGNPDIYLYLTGDGGLWTVSGIRTLATTGPLYVLAESLAALPARSADQERTLRNLRLTLAPDRELLAWAERHRGLLEQARAEPESAEAGQAIREAGALGVSRREGRIEVLVGGLVDNEVGFLFALDGVPPRIDGSRFIWIEDAGGGWYLYKTT